jgi:hypothetical protein
VDGSLHAASKPPIRQDRLVHGDSPDDTFVVMEAMLDPGLGHYVTDTIVVEPVTVVGACRHLQVEVFVSATSALLRAFSV